LHQNLCLNHLGFAPVLTNSAKVSTRLGITSTWSNGRKTVKQPTGEPSRKYRSSILKETYALDEKGDIVLVDSYTDEHYDLVLSANEDGTPAT
jgi:hypothetical protein